MSTEPPAAPLERYFPVAYDESALEAEPEQFRRLGTLMIRGSGPMAKYTFTRGARLSGSPESDAPVVFTASQIANVALAGRRIHFQAVNGFESELSRSFVFYCASPEDAAEIVALLPRTRDEDHLAETEFARKLDETDAGRPEWLSVTNALIATNVLVYIAMGLAGAGWVQEASLRPYVLYGANNGAATTDGQWWRLTASNFLHYGLIHLALNMWGLLGLGRMMERLLGSALFALVYFGSGLAGSVLTLAWNGDRIWSAGASGAVFGLVGACVGYMLREKHAIPQSVYKPTLRGAGMFVAYNVIWGLIIPNIDHAGHIGGLIGGFLLGWLVAVPADRETRRQLVPQRLQLGATLIVALFAAAVVWLPRYDYRVREELAWHDTFDADKMRSNNLITELEQSLLKHRAGQPDVPLVQRLRNEVIPFHERWITRLAALSLTPDLRTAHKRQAALDWLNLRLAAYRQLATRLEQSDPDAIPAFRRAQGKAEAAFRDFEKRP